MALLPIIIIVAQYSQGSLELHYFSRPAVCVLQRACTHETCEILCVPQRVHTHSCGRMVTQTIFVGSSTLQYASSRFARLF